MVFFEVFAFAAVVVMTVLIYGCCALCSCIEQRKNGNIPSGNSGCKYSAPIVVTSATHTAPGGYPVSQMPGGASTTTTYQTHMYAAPYPPQQGTPAQMHMPMPMPMPGNQPPAPGMQPYVAPYPPMPAAANMNPPSYDMAVGGAGSGVPNNGTYEKQSAYNPNYSTQ